MIVLKGLLGAFIAMLCATATATKQADVTWLILVDDLHIAFVDTGQLRRLLHAIADDLVQDTEPFVMHASGPVRLTLEPSTDHAWLRSVIKQAYGNGLKLDDIVQSDPAMAGELHAREQRAQDATIQLLATMTNNDARPVLLFISSGWSSGSQSSSVETVTSAAKHLRIPIVAIDPHDIAEDPLPRTDPAVVALANAARSSLQALADQTGGVALLEPRDLTDALRRARDIATRHPLRRPAGGRRSPSRRIRARSRACCQGFA
jgi:hypothetical protein